MSGWTDIGISLTDGITGLQAIGPFRLTQTNIGSLHATPVDASS